MNVNIVSVDVEVGAAPSAKSKGWNKAVVSYLKDGQPKKQNVLSFTNPQVYKDLTSGKFTGESVEVTLTKNARGYDEWAAVSLATGNAAPASTGSTTTSTATRVTGSNFETKEERARRQVLIVRQSSLSNALEFHKNAKSPSFDEVIETAQRFTDWVFDEGSDTTSDLPQDNSFGGDIPF